MTDTPVPFPPSRAEVVKSFIGDLARPFSIIVTSASAAVAPVIVAFRATPDSLDLTAAGIFVGAIYAGVGALYWGKAWELAKAGAQSAEVEKVKATNSPASPPPGTATVTAAPDVDITVRDVARDGELPPSQRLP